MNSVLSYIAGFLVLILFAALIGPSVVDWNRFRSEIEVQISEATGRDVTIAGDINFVILPTPRFSLEKIEVRTDESETVFAEAVMLEGEVSLAPLLRGEIEVKRIRARDFSVSLIRSAEGQLNWQTRRENASLAGLDPTKVSLELVTFERGRFSIVDEASGRHIEVSDVNGELKAVSLVGPFRFDGSVLVNEERFKLGTGIGVITGNRAFPVTVDIASDLFKWRAGFSGIATEASLAGRLDGVAHFQMGMPVDDEEASPFLSAKAGVVISSSQTSLRDLEINLVGSPLKGQAVLDYARDVTLTGGLSAARVHLATAIAAYNELGLPAVPHFAPKSLAGLISLSVTELDLGRLQVADASAHIAFDDGTLQLQALKGSMPGDVNIALDGVVMVENDVPRFDGKFTANVGDLTTFGQQLNAALSLYGVDAPGPSNVLGSADYLKLEMSLALQPALLQAYSLVAISGDETGDFVPVTGGISYARQSRPGFGVELRGGVLDLSVLSFLQSMADDFSDINAVDGNLIVNVDKLVYGEQALSDVDFSGTIKDGVVAITHARAMGGDGQAINVSGSLSQVSPHLTGALQGEVDAKSVALLAELAGWPLGAVETGQVVFDVAGETVDMVHRLKVKLSGQMNGADLVFSATQETPEEGERTVTFDLKLDHDEAGVLTGLVGFGSAPTGIDGHLSVRGSGGLAGVISTDLVYRSGPTSISAKGDVTNRSEGRHFAGRFEIGSDRYESFASLAGAEGFWSDLIAVNGKGGALLAAGAVEWGAETVSLSDVEAVAGSFRISGSGSTRKHGDAFTLDARLDLGRLSLDPLFTDDQPTNGIGSWSADPLNWQVLGDAQGNFNVTASAVELGSMLVEDVKIVASLADGVLSLTPVTGRFGDGRLTMGLRFEGGEGVPGLGLTLALEDARLAETTGLLLAKPLADGTVTMSLQLEGRGRSQLGLVSTLAGRGRLDLRDGLLSGFDLTQFAKGLESLAHIDEFAPLVEDVLVHGQTSFSEIGGEFTVEDGVLTYKPTQVSLEGATQTSINAITDFVRREMDIETVISLAAAQPVPPITMVLAGPLQDLERQVDALGVQNSIAQRFLIQELEKSGVEDVPSELLDLIVVPRSSDELDAPIEDGLSVDPSPTGDQGVVDDRAELTVPVAIIVGEAVGRAPIPLQRPR